MNKGGRPTDTVWQHFLKVDNEGKPGSKYAKCKHCGNIQLGKADRMRKHILSCQTQRTPVADNTFKDCGISSNEITEIETEMPSKKLKTQQCLDSHVIRTKKSDIEKLNLLVAKFFFANNIPFNIVEHHTFKELVSALHPGYTPPSRKALAGELLDQVSANVVNHMKKNVEGKQVTLIEDGWSNIHNDPIIATCIHCEGKSYFLDSIDAGTHTKNAHFHKSILQEAITKAKTEFNCDVKAVVTDNARVMDKAKEFLFEQDNNLVLYGCNAHYLNLLLQDITPIQVIQNIVKVQKFFRNHHIPSALLKEISNTVKPQLPGDTRWKSQLVCIESFHRNRHAYQKITEEHEDCIDRDISNLINNYNLYKQSKDTLSQLKPIADSLDRLQSDSATIDEACHTWLSLLKEECLQPRISDISKRMTQSMQPFHFLAYLLNPKYKGDGLSNTQKESARSFLVKKYPDSISLLIAYEAETAPFPATYFTESGRNINPVTWWTAIGKSLEQEGYSRDCLNYILLLSCPASSASIERMFSNFGMIH